MTLDNPADILDETKHVECFYRIFILVATNDGFQAHVLFLSSRKRKVHHLC